jgi:hypothetical protein
MKAIRLGVAAALSLGWSACNDATESGIPDLSGTPSFAVQRADFNGASAVALLDGDGALLEEKYISSGTELPGLNAALVGDIALPSSPCDRDVLTVVGRYGADYVLRVGLDSAKVLAQVKTQHAPEGMAFSGNPQDILCLGDGRALVSRLSVNLGVKPSDIDRGDDLLVLDLEAKKIVSRVDLSEFQGKTTSYDANGKPVEETTYARPGNIVALGEHALVGLSRYSEANDYDTDGMVALLDLKDLSVEPVELEGLMNCGTVVPVAGSDDAAIVQCGAPWVDTTSSGLAYVTVQGGKASVKHIYKPKQGEPLIYANPTSIGGTRVIAATQDYAGDVPPPDQAYAVDLATGKTQKLFETHAPGEVGSGTTRLETGLVLIPDASKGVRVFQLKDGKLEARDPIEFDAVLPARAVRPLIAF